MEKLDTLIISATALLMFALLVGAPVGCTMHRHYRIEQAIQHGADPIAAKCAIEGDNRDDAICVAYVASHGRTDK
jgi:hypothetical protein